MFPSLTFVSVVSNRSMKKPFDEESGSISAGIQFQRRAFLVSSLASGFAVAAGPLQASTTINTDEQGLLAGEVRIPVTGGDIPAYRAAPSGKSSLPTILVVQEIFGVHEHIQDICRRLAKLGYLAIAPALFARQGNPAEYQDVSSLVMELVNRVPDAQVMLDLDATADWAAKHGGNAARLGITGFCWGGRIVWLYAAHRNGLKAGVAWYGRLVGERNTLRPLQPVDVAARLKAPVLGLYAAEDVGIPVTTVNTMQQALEEGSAAAKESRFILYKKAPHAFFADYRTSYRILPSRDAWMQAQQWFRRYL